MPKSNSSIAFKIQKDMMEISGVWPQEDPSLFYRSRGIVTFVLGLGLCLTMWMEVVASIPDFARFSEIVYITITITVYIVKLANILFKRKDVLKIIDFLKDPKFTSYPEDLDHHMAKTIKIFTIISNIYRYGAIFCVILFALYPILDSKPLLFPFPYDMGRYRLSMYIFQVVAMYVVTWNNACLDILVPVFMAIGSAHLDTLSEIIVQILEVDENQDQNEDKQVEQNLKQCVEYHLAIIKLVEFIEDIFTFALFVQFLASIVAICNTLFQFVFIPVKSTQFVVLITYIALALCEIFMCCWYGNELSFKSVQVGEACYMSEWYKHDKKICKCLFIIMERSKRPLVITTMKFSKLSLTAFTAILQWSYSILTLLMNMYSEN